MLRRRMFLTTIIGGYYWAISRIKLLMERKADPITAPAEEAVTGRRIINKRNTEAHVRIIAEGFTDRYTSALSKPTNPEAADAVEASRFSKIFTSRKGNAYSILEAIASSRRSFGIKRWANAILVHADIAKSYRSLCNGSFEHGSSSTAVEVNSEIAVCNGSLAVCEAVELKNATAIKAFLIERQARPIAASVASSASGIGIGIQNATCANAYSWIYPYYEDDMLVIRQAHTITETDNRLEVQ